MGFLVALGGFLALFLFKDMGALPATPKITMNESVLDAIMQGIVKPLGLPDVSGVILQVQSKLETGAWKSVSFQMTRSLFNRHMGSGRGEWLGSGIPKANIKLGAHIYYAGPGDADLRIYSDIYQSARDMAQLLRDPLYVQALAALRKGSAPEYYNALGAAGFAADTTYAANLKRMYEAQA